MTIGSLFRGTWAFIRTNPRAIGVWTLIHLLLGLVMRWAMAPFQQAQAANALAKAQGLPPSFPPMGRMLLMGLAAGLIAVALYNAVFRAVFWPEERRAAYLRFGKDEGRLVGLVVIFILAWILVVIVGVILAVIMGLLAGGLGEAGVGYSGLGLLGFLFAIALLCAWIYVAVRLCAVAPLTLYRHELSIGEGWALTHGCFWRLFGAFLGVMLLLLAISLPFMLPTMIPAVQAALHPGDPAAQQQLAMLQAEQLAHPWSATMIAQTVISGLLGGITLAVFGGMPAVATLQMIDEKAGL